MRTKHDETTITIVAVLAPEQIARGRPNSHGGWIAVVDCGPSSYVSDADAPQYAASEAEACALVKAWMLDDLSCGGNLGKPQYQPHWDSYDVLYRLAPYWRSKSVTQTLTILANGSQSGIAVPAGE